MDKIFLFVYGVFVSGLLYLNIKNNDCEIKSLKDDISILEHDLNMLKKNFRERSYIDGE